MFGLYSASASSTAGTKCAAVTRLMLCAPCASSSRKISESRFGVTIFPSPRWLMLSFWQNTHRSPQPEKNTAPLPRVPLMQGSSHRCSAARAILGSVPMRQTPVPCSGARSAPQFLGQSVQIIGR